ncbi:MAG: right-handed parallel beta-helix repeat-containing protein [Planctomycetota bacterium]|nr:MAG: right-handed parallel beta-helix repeat-containing protein [Planctomycetota bacterium]
MRGENGVLSILVGVLVCSSVGMAGQQVLEVSPRYLEFTGYEGGGDPAAQVLSIWNSGKGPMNWTVTPDCGWVTVEPNSGSSMGEVDDANIIVDINELSAGIYDCQLTVTGSGAPNSPQVVDVNLVVHGPAIGLSATQFEFTAYEGGEYPDDQILSISNIGGGTLNWTISEDCNWLSVEPNAGSSTGEADDVNLSVDISGLGWGTYDCELIISDANASNSPREVGVTLSIYHDDLHVPSEYGTIQAGIDAAVDGDRVIVAPGTYTGDGNRNLDFGGKAITVRSANGPESCIIDCGNVFGKRGFYFHTGEGPNSVVRGFTIKRGRKEGYDPKGGGIYCDGSSPTIEDCIITDNLAAYSYFAAGGGICCTSSSNPAIINCKIKNNITHGLNPGDFGFPGGPAYGGGIYSSSDSHPTIENCIIIFNTAIGGSGFGAGASGGDAHGGGFCGRATIKNSTISNNSAVGGFGDPAGVSYGGGVYCSSSPTISNGIVWGNSAYWEAGISGSASVSYSDVQGGYIGIGNIDADPCFVDPCNGDYHLQSAAGRWDANSESWVIDLSTSPCIDAGDPSSEWTEELWPHGGRINMGAYGGTAEASMSLSSFGSVADFNCDFVIDVVDLGMFADMWLAEDVPLKEDTNRDGVVNFLDYEDVAENWLQLAL